MQQMCKNDTVLLQDLQTNLQTCKSDLEEISKQLKLHEQNSYELFIAAKRALAKMTKLQFSLQEITMKIGYQRYSVVIDPRLQKIVKGDEGFADIEQGIIDLHDGRLRKEPDLQLGNEELEIVDMTEVSDDKILLTAKHKRKLILLDSKTDTVLSEIVLKDKPRFICMVNPNQAATTLLNKTVKFLNIKDTIVIDDFMLEVDVYVMGVAAYNNNLVFAYDPPGVKIISKDGAVIHKLDNTTAGREVFKSPRWVATTLDSIYVTDFGTHTITRLDASLTIVQTFSGPMIKNPHGIISLNRDQLLVCNKTINSNIVLIRPSTNSITVLLNKQHGIKSPKSLCFSKQQKLYIAPGGETTSVFVYKLT